MDALPPRRGSVLAYAVAADRVLRPERDRPYHVPCSERHLSPANAAQQRPVGIDRQLAHHRRHLDHAHVAELDPGALRGGRYPDYGRLALHLAETRAA